MKISGLQRSGARVRPNAKALKAYKLEWSIVENWTETLQLPYFKMILPVMLIKSKNESFYHFEN